MANEMKNRKSKGEKTRRSTFHLGVSKTIVIKSRGSISFDLADESFGNPKATLQRHGKIRSAGSRSDQSGSKFGCNEETFSAFTCESFRAKCASAMCT